MSEAEECISASFKEWIFFSMQSSEDLRAFGIMLEITVDRFVFCRVLTLILCFEDSFAVDWSIIVDYAIIQFRCRYQTTWIYFILMLMKRRIKKVKKSDLLISTSTTTYKLQLHNWYHFQNMVVGWFLPSNIFQWYAAELYRCFISRSIRRSYKLSDLVLFHSISLHIYEFYIWGNITLFLSAQLLHSE